MITLTQLASEFAAKLNAPQSGLEFKVFTDTGKWRKAIRKQNMITTVVNGLYTNVSSDMTNTNNGITVATMTNKIELIFPCKDEEEDIYESITLPDGSKKQNLVEVGNETFVKQIREIIDTVCANNTFTTLSDNKGVTFDVSAAYSAAVTGVRSQLPELGDCFTFIIYGYYNVIQGGRNSREWEIYLDGERIPYSTATFRKVPTQETNIYDGDLDSKNITVANTWGLSLDCPALVGKFSTAIQHYINYGSDNNVHILTLQDEEDSVTHSYAVIFGQVSATASGVMNIGYTISFAKAVEMYGISEFPSDYLILKAKQDFNMDTYADGEYVQLIRVPENENVNLLTVSYADDKEKWNPDIYFGSDTAYNLTTADLFAKVGDLFIVKGIEWYNANYFQKL